jgi:hypothetical protein
MVNAATGGNSGLSGFLAKAATFADDASFAIQSALEVARNTLYARRLVVPDGLGSQIVVPDIDNLASYKPAPNGRPIHEMSDEYVERNAGDPAYDKAELARVEAALALQTPEQLELKARMELRKRGVNVDKPNPALMLLGRGAFAAVSYVAPFGLAKADGKLGVVDQGVSMIL